MHWSFSPSACRSTLNYWSSQRQKTQQYNQILSCPVRHEEKFDHLQQSLKMKAGHAHLPFSTAYPGTPAGAELALQSTPWAAMGMQNIYWIKWTGLVGSSHSVPTLLVFWELKKEGVGGRFLKYTETFTTTLFGAHIELVLLMHCMRYEGMRFCLLIQLHVVWHETSLLLVSSLFNSSLTLQPG